MLRITTCLVIVLTVSFGQYLMPVPGQKDNDDIRLAPKLMNYQGFMTDTLNNPINDSLDILFRIYDAPSSGNLIWSESQLEVPILKGIFHVLLGTVTPIPDSVFTKGTDRWLELRISSQNLAPRTRFTALPYAYTSDYADTADYARNAGYDNDWTRATGKVYTYNLTDTVGIRTTAPRYALDVNGVICGGTSDTVLAVYGAVLGGYSNLAGDAAADTGAVVAGGIDNAAIGKWSVVGGGRADTAGYHGATVAGGVHNVANLNNYATVGGGVGNVANGYSSTVAGGYYNTASFGGSAIAGGFNNYTGYEVGTVGGGEADTARAWYSGVFSGYSNKAGFGSYDTAAVVAGGFNNSATGKYSYVGGGRDNLVAANYAAILGGLADTIAAAGHYSYLFGINSNLTQDSTLMVDLPHIRFGKETGGYEFPTSDGSSGQVMVTNGAGLLSWGTNSDNDWSRSGSRIYTYNLSDTVGIRTASPQYALDVNGDLRTDRVVYNSPRSHLCTVGSEGFFPDTDNPYVNGSGSGGAYIDTAITGSLYASLSLPHNATITEFKIYFYDNSTSSLSVSLLRQYLGISGYGILATIATTGASTSYRVDSTTTITNPVVNSEICSYLVNAYCNPWPGTSSLRIKGAVITYTIPEAD